MGDIERLRTLFFFRNKTGKDGEWETIHEGTVADPGLHTPGEVMRLVEMFVCLPEYEGGEGDDRWSGDKAGLSIFTDLLTVHLYFHSPDRIRFELFWSSKLPVDGVHENGSRGDTNMMALERTIAKLATEPNPAEILRLIRTA